MTRAFSIVAIVLVVVACRQGPVSPNQLTIAVFNQGSADATFRWTMSGDAGPGGSGAEPIHGCQPYRRALKAGDYTITITTATGPHSFQLSAQTGDEIMASYVIGPSGTVDRLPGPAASARTCE